MKAKAVPVVLLVVGLFAGKTFLGGSGGASAATAGATTTTTAPGPIITLGSTTVNLSDGHILKVGVSLQLAHASKLATPTSSADSSDPTKGWAPVLDEAIRVFGDQTYAALIAPGGRESARQQLLARLKVRYDTDVEDVYLYEFVMQ